MKIENNGCENLLIAHSILLTKTMNKVFFDANDYKRLTESVSFTNIGHLR